MQTNLLVIETKIKDKNKTQKIKNLSAICRYVASYLHDNGITLPNIKVD